MVAVSLKKKTFANVSGATKYPTGLSPAVWALHDGTLAFLPADVAHEGVERLAEDGNGSVWLTMLQGETAVAATGIANVPVGAASAGPSLNRSSYQIVVQPTATARYFHLASMVGTSNDTFLAVGGQGVALADANGNVRSAADIQADLAAALVAWDAGTEANQASALGPDQAPRQAAPNTGAGEGSGLVRDVSDQVWRYPLAHEIVRVTITLVDAD